MKSVLQALIDEIHYPIPVGYVENACIKRGLDPDDEVSSALMLDNAYKGALADCLFSLIQAINFSEADKSIGNLSETQRRFILKWANRLYGEIGEEEVYEGNPTVYFNC